jgi:general secretion pathway protein H
MDMTTQPLNHSTTQPPEYLIRRTGGFSLVELLVVLVMLGLLAGVSAPAIGRYYDNLEYRKQVGEITAVLRYARLMAVTRGKPVQLALAEEGVPTLRLTGAVEEQRPVGAGEGERLMIEPAEIVFFPEGRATPGRITFSRGERSRTILLDPLSGLPVFE